MPATILCKPSSLRIYKVFKLPAAICSTPLLCVKPAREILSEVMTLYEHSVADSSMMLEAAPHCYFPIWGGWVVTATAPGKNTIIMTTSPSRLQTGLHMLTIVVLTMRP